MATNVFSCRSQLILGIVIFLDKMCRGSLARKQYKGMIAARYLRISGDKPTQSIPSPTG